MARVPEHLTDAGPGLAWVRNEMGQQPLGWPHMVGGEEDKCPAVFAQAPPARAAAWGCGRW